MKQEHVFFAIEKSTPVSTLHVVEMSPASILHHYQGPKVRVSTKEPKALELVGYFGHLEGFERRTKSRQKEHNHEFSLTNAEKMEWNSHRKIDQTTRDMISAVLWRL